LEIFINNLLLKVFNLRNTTHERNLYSGTINGKPILVKRQVDDIAVASPFPATAQEFIAALGHHVQLKGNDLLSTFNGIQVEQSSDSIRIHCTRYIERLVASHGWDTSTTDTPDTPYHNNSQPRELVLLLHSVAPSSSTARNCNQRCPRMPLPKLWDGSFTTFTSVAQWVIFSHHGRKPFRGFKPNSPHQLDSFDALLLHFKISPLIHARESKNQCQPFRPRPLLSSQSLIPSYLDFIIV
jgi:hypothetical protein